MKRSLIATVALAGVLSAASAASAAGPVVTGSVVITGTVESKCTVITAGSPPVGATFGNTVALGELAQANGTLRTDIQSGTPIAALSNSYQLACTGANLGVSVDANALTNATAGAAGYSNTIDFTGRATFARVGNTSAPLAVSNLTTAAGATPGSLGAGNFLANAPANITIDAFSFNTANPTDLLVAGSYSGNIVVTVTPS